MLAGSVGKKKKLDRSKEKRKMRKPGPGFSSSGMSNKVHLTSVAGHMEDITC